MPSRTCERGKAVLISEEAEIVRTINHRKQDQSGISLAIHVYVDEGPLYHTLPHQIDDLQMFRSLSSSCRLPNESISNPSVHPPKPSPVSSAPFGLRSGTARGSKTRKSGLPRCCLCANGAGERVGGVGRCGV